MSLSIRVKFFRNTYNQIHLLGVCSVSQLFKSNYFSKGLTLVRNRRLNHMYVHNNVHLFSSSYLYTPRVHNIS